MPHGLPIPAGKAAPVAGRAGTVKWYETVYELIDMRSFSNLWFWIALAVQWSMASHWVVGVPYDMVLRARRAGGQAEQDLQDIVRVNVNRLLYIGRTSGLWIVAFACFLLTVLVTLGFAYNVEFAQAVLCLFFPMTLIGLLSLRTASLIEATWPTGEDLHRRLLFHRMTVQGIGVVAILVTSLWGMFQNLKIGVF